MRLFLAIVVALVVAACASMGRPEGGPIDETPPVFVRSNPAPGSLNVEKDRIIIEFDENVQIKDAMNKVVVSPTQKTMPKISAVGRRVTVELMDSLLPNTTYTIDFTDAISDLNEGNGLDGFAFDFATGSTIDSLCIAGMVFQAENLEPAQGMLVGVHSNQSDTALTKLPFDRITKTNQYGQFILRNLKEGNYRVFAIDDVNRDNKWDRTEDIAFYPQVVTPTASRVERNDTLKDASGADSIVVREVTAYAPVDLLLTWSNENYKSHYIAKYARKERNKITFEMGAPSDSLPQLTIVGGPFDGRRFEELSVLNASPTLDTLEYWITDTTLIALDSIAMATRYLRTDSLEQISWATDTLQFNMRPQKEKKKKKDDEKTDTMAVPPLTLLQLKSLMSGTADVFSKLVIETDQPIAQKVDSAFHLEVMRDTVWEAVAAPTFDFIDSLRPMRLGADYAWEPGMKYRFTVDSIGVTGIYNQWNGKYAFEFTVRKLEDYANLSLGIVNLPGNAVVQLLNPQDAPVRYAVVENGEAVFRHIMPGDYYARLFIDANSNGKWDTGNVADSIQPEDVYYYPKKINLKKNWDVQQTWDLMELPVDMQKPHNIKKNKPKIKGGDDLMNGEEEEEQYYDEFGNPAVDPDDPFGKRKNRRYNDLNSRDNMMNGQGAGYRSGGYR